MSDRLSVQLVRTKVSNLNRFLGLNDNAPGSYQLQTQLGIGHTLYRMSDYGRSNITHGATNLREVERFIVGMMEGIRTERDRHDLRKFGTTEPRNEGAARARANQQAAARRLAERNSFNGA